MTGNLDDDLAKRAERSFESAIPGHLRQSRSCPRRVEDAFRPVNTSYSARFSPDLKEVVVCYCGIQFREFVPAVSKAVGFLVSLLGGDTKPRHWDRATYLDSSGFQNDVFALYWDSHAAFERWRDTPSNRLWWDGRANADDGVGCFRELVTLASDAFETIFSHRRKDGAACLAETMSGEVLEHGYWGSARDRIPLSQTDQLKPSGALMAAVDPASNGRRIRVSPHRNLCVIRSGQDWSLTLKNERELYFSQLQPHLAAGMKFLAEEGRPIGCYSNRFMNIVDSSRQNMEKTYSISFWESLSHLEKWSEFHQTHLLIFHSAIRYYKGLGDSANLQLYHEVSILSEENSFFEYIDCHTMTGMLAAL